MKLSPCVALALGLSLSLSLSLSIAPEARAACPPAGCGRDDSSTSIAPAKSPSLAAATLGRPVVVATFGRWQAVHVTDSNGDKRCYAVAQPETSEPTLAGRGPVYFTVTTELFRGVRNETSTIIGYVFRKNAPVAVEIDGARFAMFSQGDAAWIELRSDEPALVAAMKNGIDMTVLGTSAGGTTTADAYPLSGLAAALDVVARECP
jgi:hypothetical protein